MSMRIVFVALGLMLGAAPGRAEISYVGSSTIGATIMPEATRTFTAKTREEAGGALSDHRLRRARNLRELHQPCGLAESGAAPGHLHRQDP